MWGQMGWMLLPEGLVWLFHELLTSWENTDWCWGKKASCEYRVSTDCNTLSSVIRGEWQGEGKNTSLAIWWSICGLGMQDCWDGMVWDRTWNCYQAMAIWCKSDLMYKRNKMPFNWSIYFCNQFLRSDTLSIMRLIIQLIFYPSQSIKGVSTYPH